MFASFHNQSPLLTMVSGKLKCVLQWNLDITKGLGTGNTVRYNEISLCRGSVFLIYWYCTINEKRNVLRYTEDFFIYRFVKLSGCHCTFDLTESSYQPVNILVIFKSVTRTIATMLINVTNLKIFVWLAVHAAFLKYLATVALARVARST